MGVCIGESIVKCSLNPSLPQTRIVEKEGRKRLQSMPPPKKREEAPEPEAINYVPYRLTAKDIQNEFDDVMEGEYECRLIVNSAVEAMEEEIVRGHMDHMSIPWTVESILTELAEAMDVAFAEREPLQTEPLDCSSSAVLESGSSFHFVEPSTVAPDSWSRASIAQRHLLVRPDSEQFALQAQRRNNCSADSTRRASPSSATTKPLGTPSEHPVLLAGSLVPGSEAMLRHVSKLKGSGHKQSVKPTAQDSVTTASDNPAGDELQDEEEEEEPPSKNDEDVWLEENLKQQKRRMNDLREATNKISRQLSELRNTQQSYVVDGATHSVVVVSPPNPQLLPPGKAEVRVAVESDSVQPAPQPSPRRTAFTAPSAKKKPRPKQTVNAQNFWEPERQISPMITDVVPAAGVASKEGDVVRKAELKNPKMRMCKGDFAKLVQLQQATTVAVGSEVEEPQRQPVSSGAKSTAPNTATGKSDSHPTAASPPPAPTADSNQEERLPDKRALPPKPMEYRPQNAALLPSSRPATPSINLLRGPVRRGDAHSPRTRSRDSTRASTPSESSSRLLTPLPTPSTKKRPVIKQPSVLEDDVARDFVDSLNRLSSQSS